MWDYCPSDLHFTLNRNAAFWWKLKLPRFLTLENSGKIYELFAVLLLLQLDLIVVDCLASSEAGSRRKVSAVSADTLAPLRKQIAKSKEFPMFSIISHLMGLHGDCNIPSKWPCYWIQLLLRSQFLSGWAKRRELSVYLRDCHLQFAEVGRRL